MAVEQLTQELEALRIAQANAETEKQELAAKEAASQKELEATKTTLKEAMRVCALRKTPQCFWGQLLWSIDPLKKETLLF